MPGVFPNRIVVIDDNTIEISGLTTNAMPGGATGARKATIEVTAAQTVSGPNEDGPAGSNTTTVRFSGDRQNGTFSVRVSNNIQPGKFQPGKMFYFYASMSDDANGNELATDTGKRQAEGGGKIDELLLNLNPDMVAPPPPLRGLESREEIEAYLREARRPPQ